MPVPVDARDADRTYATKDNIVRDSASPNPAPSGPTRAQARTGTLGASAVASDSGQLPAGTYRVIARLNHRGAAAANRGLQVEHRDSGNLTTVKVLVYCPAGSEAYYESTRVLAANERIRVVTDTDATNLGLDVDLIVRKV